jgi:DNA-binding HxlR family transcriptional regulator
MTMPNTRAATAEFTLKIVCALQHGPLRFCEIDRAVCPANHPILSARLKKLVRDGLIVRNVHRLGPPAVVSYELTRLGAKLAKPAAHLLDFVDEHATEIEAAREYHRALSAAT